MAQREMPRYLTQRAAAGRLGVSMYTLGQMMDAGTLSGVKVTTESGHERLQISEASVEAELARRQTGKAA